MNQLLDELSQKGIRVSAKGDSLTIQAPKGVITPEIKQLLQINKKEILNSLIEQNSEINLQAEVLLEPQLYPQKQVVYHNHQQVESIFITGVTGFLGAFILQELLDKTQANIYCLVRAKSHKKANQKVKHNLDCYGLWDNTYSSRIICILGDLSQPKLGLTENDFNDLAQKIDIIYHSGALLNWVCSYAALKPINVLGTHEIIKLACEQKVKPVHYISTLAVWESAAYAGKIVSEAEPLTHWQGIKLGYSQSKWVAEKLILEAHERGLPVTIYRPPLISGHSQTGAWNTDDVVCRVIKGCLQMGSMPSLDYLLNLSPVDYVSRAIVCLSQQEESIGQIFHLNNLQPLHWESFVDWMRNFGYKINLLAYENWAQELNTIKSCHQNPLSPLLPFFQKRSSNGDLLIPQQYNCQRVPKYSCQQTFNVLSSQQISCPPVDNKLLNKYFIYFIKNNFLSTP
ncbi:hypothetical protein DSM106972_025080 [Dulcicalothrix desertica PCC 7102]|uniref:Polyketide synthase n=1 Tax=Dulcicalothrix desertica PCC 7102 TaxID=232991 RepID=A0A433VME7_9CYAN|nr:thioester reductase domain-containing protein [Dulcicalothrix desertica]RUT07247.1 hypothetical protein DSM106972_025080 [Dulcicalothrix desertica PCC 7102]TWH61759.1 thioester reductase-like protein [Dulcicalothrix desertica PCC 7102]